MTNAGNIDKSSARRRDFLENMGQRLSSKDTKNFKSKHKRFFHQWLDFIDLVYKKCDGNSGQNAGIK
jgi:hypothetical protein